MYKPDNTDVRRSHYVAKCNALFSHGGPDYRSPERARCHSAGHPQSVGRNMWVEVTLTSCRLQNSCVSCHIFTIHSLHGDLATSGRNIYTTRRCSSKPETTLQPPLRWDKVRLFATAAISPVPCSSPSFADTSPFPSLLSLLPLPRFVGQWAKDKHLVKYWNIILSLVFFKCETIFKSLFSPLS